MKVFRKESYLLPFCSHIFVGYPKKNLKHIVTQSIGSLLPLLFGGSLILILTSFSFEDSHHDEPLCEEDIKATIPASDNDFTSTMDAFNTFVTINVTDDFSSGNYSGGSPIGTDGWLTNWTENNDDNNAGGGSIEVASQELHFEGTSGSPVRSIQRAVDITGAASALLNFDWRSDNSGLENTDNLKFSYSTDGGSTFIDLFDENGDFLETNTPGSESYLITGLSVNSILIRFEFVASATSENFYIDNVAVQYDDNGGSVCIPPEVSAFAIQASCLNNAPQSDGYLQLSTVTVGDRYHWSTGNTFDDNGGANTYANATNISGATYPLQIATGQPNPSGSQDYTIRVFNGASDCFTDVVVTMQEQDCTEGCDCIDYLYVNDVDLHLVHKFEINPTDGSLTEIGNPWLNNINRPHGVVPDLNGNLYVGSKTPQEVVKVTCAGAVLDTVLSQNDYPTLDYNNFVTEGNILYINGRGDFTVEAYDLCTGNFLGEVTIPPGSGYNWELYKGPDGKLYSHTRTDDILTIYEMPFDLSYYVGGQTYAVDTLVTNVDPGTDTEIWGSTLGSDGYFYVQASSSDPAIPTELYKVDATTGLAVDTAYLFGFTTARGIVYSETANKLYLASEDGYCVGIIDPVTLDVDPVNSVPGGGGKGVTINDECCPINNNQSIETLVCDGSVGDTLFLQELINCTGTICEGIWQEGLSNSGLSYDPCDNSVTITSLDACGNFTLESDGTGPYARCGAFKITVSIKVENVSTPAITAGTTPACANNNDPGAITISTASTGSSTVSYRWQSSTTDCSSGFSDIAGAPTDGSDYDPSSIAQETYYRVIAEVNNLTCQSGVCADTSNCITLTPEAGCVPVCINPTASILAIQPSCVGGVIQSDGYLQISSVTDGTHYHFSIGNTFDDNGGANTFANATSLSGVTYPLQVATGQPNPSSSQDYTVRVFNGTNDCFTDVVVTMQEQELPMATVADVLKCTDNSETITVVPSGGTGPYTYTWSGPFITNPGDVASFATSIPGTYTVTVTDNEGCTSASSGEVTFQSKVCLPTTFTIRRGTRN